MNIPLLKIEHDAHALFQQRPNRFLGVVDIIDPVPEQNVNVHIHDPGRLTDILVPNARLLLRAAKNQNRKTKWDLIAGFCNNHWVLINSGFHRIITERILNDERISPFGVVKNISAEVTYGHSRLDFLITQFDDTKIWIEVKGCTLAENGVATFPDAPTTRGRKHLETLTYLREKGERAAIIILIFRKDAGVFSPNAKIDPHFAQSFQNAVTAGVEVYPLQLIFHENTIEYLSNLPLVEL